PDLHLDLDLEPSRAIARFHSGSCVGNARSANEGVLCTSSEQRRSRSPRRCQKKKRAGGPPTSPPALICVNRCGQPVALAFRDVGGWAIGGARAPGGRIRTISLGTH